MGNWSWYKWLWTRIGGRPWTFIIRDSYHNMPVVWLILCMAAGAFIGNQFGMLVFLKFLGLLLVGILIGHLFWGSKYKPNQPGITIEKVKK